MFLGDAVPGFVGEHRLPAGSRDRFVHLLARLGIEHSVGIERALHQAEGNVTRAAQACGMTRAALQRIMRSLDIERETFAEA